MLKNVYEHHLSISDPLYPFKLDYHKYYSSHEINWHKGIELILVNKGNGCIYCGSNEYEVNPGDIIIINSGVMHRIDCKDGMEFYYLIILDKFFYENGIEFMQYQFCEFVHDSELEDKFRNAIRYIDYKKNKDPMIIPLIRKSILEIMIDICTRHVTDKTDITLQQHASDAYIKKAISYIHDHFTEDISLDEIASFVNISKYHLTREFKKITGDTIFSYINILRCTAASAHLAHGMSISEAARECGFDTAAYFSRIFKKVMGIPPSKAQKHKTK